MFLQTILTCIINGLLINSFWFSYILFITFIGGILVLFIYIARIASNEKFYFSNKLIFYISFILIIILIIIIFDFQIFPNYSFNETFSYINKNIIIKNENIISITKIFNYPYIYISILIIIYLLITIISIVKITNIKEGPLRIKN